MPESFKTREERYRALIEDVADGFYEVDLHGNFTFFNDALCRIFGYPREEILNRSYSDFMDAANARVAYEAFNRIFRTGGDVADITWEIIRPDSERRFLEISARLIIGADGRKTGFRGTARDVTDRHLAQQALRESQECALELSESSRRAEQRYRAFLNFLPDPVFVFNLDGTVSFLNPAFEKVFGWSLAELEGRKIPFVPAEEKARTRAGLERLYREKVLHGFETKRLTKDGRLLDLLIDGAIFYDEDNRPAGQVITLRDITQAKRTERINQALFRIAQALYRYRALDARLEFITREVRQLLDVEGASVILLDEDRKEFFFRVSVFDDQDAGQRMKEVRFPIDKGVAGEVLRTGKPLIVNDTSQSPFFFAKVDKEAAYRTRSMLDVPLATPERMIGVLCAVNKKDALFTEDDASVLSAVANLVALPVENASFHDALERSFEEVQRLNRAKDRVIHHLSHELKTPLSVLSASLNLLAKPSAGAEGEGRRRETLERARRNLQRMLDMQYKIEDMLHEKEMDHHRMLSLLLDQCSDELEALTAEEFGEESATERLRRRIDQLFGPREAKPELIHLARFADRYLNLLRPRFAHRRVAVQSRLEESPPIRIPADVLSKVIEGLVRNAVENTPDGGEVHLSVRAGDDGPLLEIRDTGIGMAAETQRLIFGNFFTAYEPMQYSTRRPYDFRAGGKGLDLLRMQIFAERYGFSIRMDSNRCRHLPAESDECPGEADQCRHVTGSERCTETGGTVVSVQFRLPAKAAP
ncbi:MAG: PAS domain S-box protein [Desulfobacterales bacterium]|nr:PAS domain S-box protein [Desulfobacterales bacterium]